MRRQFSIYKFNIDGFFREYFKCELNWQIVDEYKTALSGSALILHHQLEPMNVTYKIIIHLAYAE